MFVTTEDDARRARKHDQELEQRIAALQSVEIFRPLSDDERQELAGRLQLAPFSRGEAMVRQGDLGDWLYLIHRGTADVRVSIEGASQSRHVGALREGDYFGEMGLMTGEPRTATIVALTDVECYRLDKEGFIDILRRRPQIADEISHLLAQRRTQLDTIREGPDRRSGSPAYATHPGRPAASYSQLFHTRKRRYRSGLSQHKQSPSPMRGGTLRWTALLCRDDRRDRS